MANNMPYTFLFHAITMSPPIKLGTDYDSSGDEDRSYEYSTETNEETTYSITKSHRFRSSSGTSQYSNSCSFRYSSQTSATSRRSRHSGSNYRSSERGRRSSRGSQTSSIFSDSVALIQRLRRVKSKRAFSSTEVLELLAVPMLVWMVRAFLRSRTRRVKQPGPECARPSVGSEGIETVPNVEENLSCSSDTIISPNGRSHTVVRSKSVQTNRQQSLEGPPTSRDRPTAPKTQSLPTNMPRSFATSSNPDRRGDALPSEQPVPHRIFRNYHDMQEDKAGQIAKICNELKRLT